MATAVHLASAAAITFCALPILAATGVTDSSELPKLAPPHAELPPTFWEQHGVAIVAASVAAGLIAAGAVAWRWLRPKPAVLVPIEDQTRQELNLLSQRAEDGNILSQVSRCLRHYLTHAFSLPPEEQTTAELCRALGASEKIGPDLAGRIGSLLRQMDEMKFALRSSSPSPQPHAVRALELLELAEARRAWLRAAAQRKPAAPPPLPK